MSLCGLTLSKTSACLTTEIRGEHWMALDPGHFVEQARNRIYDYCEDMQVVIVLHPHTHNNHMLRNE